MQRAKLMSKQVVAPAVADLLSLNGQRALVTGASGNIGHGIAVRLAEAGADIIVHYLNDADGAAVTVHAIKATGRDAVSVQADLTRADEVARMFSDIEATGPSPGCVVNNAGGYPVQPFAEISAVEWQQVVAANLDSAVYVSQEAIRRMCDQAPSGGVIVNMGFSTDIADAVLFLLSPASRWISGINLVVDGGMSTVSRW